MGPVALLILRAVSGFLLILPRRVQLALGAGLGWILRTAGFRAKVVRQNIEIGYPGTASSEFGDDLFKGAYRHLGRLILELLYLFYGLRRFCLKYGELRGVENWKAAKAQGHGAIILSSHVGNWEVMAATGALHAGIDIMLVTKHLKPKWIHRAVEKGRALCGVKGTYEPRTFRDVFKHLSNNGTVGLVLDQYAGAPVGVRVPFFGVPVGTHTVVATLARRTHAPVLPALNYRKPDGTFVVEIFEALPWIEREDPSEELAVNTARYAEVLEAHVRAHREQWLWTHRRFKGDLTALRPGEWVAGRSRR